MDATKKERLRAISASLSETLKLLDATIEILEEEAGEYADDEASDLIMLRADLLKVADAYSHRVPTPRK